MVNRSRSQSHEAPRALELAQDRAAGLLLPLPDPFDKFLASELVAVEPVFRELTLDHVLRGDPGVIDAGHPERIRAAHPLPAGQYILEGIVEGMSHVEGAGDVRRGNHHRERGAVRLGLGMEKPLFFPEGDPFFFDPLGVVHFFQNFL
ncbi:MAG: hypothetical protein MPW14_11175 [Candidatus Manganitrophus sp.]|nr:MAG: hypothetical protein MPW14_11175 [Candidatus Manganitrophus sp.]